MNRQQRISLDRWLTTPPDGGDDDELTQAHSDGWGAFEDGAPLHTNPHQTTEHEWSVWREGWRDAQWAERWYGDIPTGDVMP